MNRTGSGYSSALSYAPHVTATILPPLVPSRPVAMAGFFCVSSGPTQRPLPLDPIHAWFRRLRDPQRHFLIGDSDLDYATVSELLQDLGQVSRLLRTASAPLTATHIVRRSRLR